MEGAMPNQKHRLKKAGTNKIKKTAAMRAKESIAKPRRPPSATGKGIRETSRVGMVNDRQGILNRA
jgi:hypothetical protein